MITIANRLRPFSHQPKTRCLIPGTEFLVEVCPARLRVLNISCEVQKEVFFDIKGPLEQFTVFQDLERGCVTVTSEVVSYHLLPNLEIVHTKNPHLPPLDSQERLSLGSHKKQEWEGIAQRGDFREIFPLWFRLGSLLTLPERNGSDKGVFSLLQGCKEAIAAHRPECIVPAFRKLFLAGFHHMLVPRRFDDDFQGILPPEAPLGDHSPLYLLTEGAELIRSLFLKTSGNVCTILPNLPPEFFAGRMLDLEFPGIGELDLEWSKKRIRRLVLRPKIDGEVVFHFPTHVRSFLVLGERVRCNEPIKITANAVLTLNQFTNQPGLC